MNDAVIEVIEEFSLVQAEDADIVVVREKEISILSEGIQGPAGTPGDGVMVFGEVPAGLVNGSNAIFATAFDFVPESVDLSVNGLRQKKIDDFNTSGTTQINTTVSPEVGDKILVNYLRA